MLGGLPPRGWRTDNAAAPLPSPPLNAVALARAICSADKPGCAAEAGGTTGPRSRGNCACPPARYRSWCDYKDTLRRRF